MPVGVYTWRGINVRHHRRAESPGYFEPAGGVRALRRRARAAAPHAADVGVEALEGAARRRVRRSTRGRAAASLSDPAGAADGGRRVARAVPALLVGPCGCTRAPSRPDGTLDEKRKEPMSNREKYV